LGRGPGALAWQSLRTDRDAERGIVRPEVLAELSARAHPIGERLARPPSVRGCPVVPCAERDEPVGILPVLDQEEVLATGRFVGGAHQRRPASHEFLFAPIPHGPDPAGVWLADRRDSPSSSWPRRSPR